MVAARIDKVPVGLLGAAAQAGHRDVCELLVEFQASPHEFDEQQQTALHRACTAGREEILFALRKYYLDYGADCGKIGTC